MGQHIYCWHKLCLEDILSWQHILVGTGEELQHSLVDMSTLPVDLPPDTGYLVHMVKESMDLDGVVLKTHIT